MAWLSDATLEKRCRRKLAKYGYQLHKSRKQGGGYTVTGGPYPDEPDGWYGILTSWLTPLNRWKNALQP